VQLPVDLASELTGHPGHRFELLSAGCEEAIRRAEMTKKGPLPRRAYASHAVEHRGRHRLVATASMVGDRKAVGLVADALQDAKGV
jgi:hypothetical protein